MDRLDRLLREYTQGVGEDRHACRVALRLLRRIRHGTKGNLELRYLLDDLVDELDASAVSPLHEELRRFANALREIDIPLKAKKRHSESDSVEDDSRQKRQRRDLEDAQLLYNYLIPLPLPQPGPKRKRVAALLDLPTTGQTIPSRDVDATLPALYTILEPLIPERGTLTAKKTKLAELCNQQDHTPAGEIEALYELVQFAAQLCAPSRDQEAKTAVGQVEACREYVATHLDGKLRDAERTKVLLAVHELLRSMQRDMQAFKLGLTAACNSDEELVAMIRQEAMKREKDALDTAGTHTVLEASKAWLLACLGEKATFTKQNLQKGLVEALFRPIPVSSDASADAANKLPPIFRLATQHLFILQNRLQAATILATLATIVSSSPAAEDWASRVHTLLLSEITPDAESADPLKLANVADEIERAVQPDAAHKDSLRANVHRMLNFHDPVYVLLNGRLKIAMTADGGQVEEIKGFGLSPLPSELAEIREVLKSILDWACESWNIV